LGFPVVLLFGFSFLLGFFGHLLLFCVLSH
jgi:hypothetical protein